MWGEEMKSKNIRLYVLLFSYQIISVRRTKDTKICGSIASFPVGSCFSQSCWFNIFLSQLSWSANIALCMWRWTKLNDRHVVSITFEETLLTRENNGIPTEKTDMHKLMVKWALKKKFHPFIYCDMKCTFFVHY